MLNRIASTGVVIDFTIGLNHEGTEIHVMDCTKPDVDNTDTIYDLRLSLVSEATNTTLYEVDLIAYLFSNRKDREWYVITSDMLGIGEGQLIPDGIYTISIRANNTYTRTHNFVIYREIREKAKLKLLEAGYKVEVGTNSFQYQNSTKYDFEEMSLIYSLLSAIETNCLDGNLEAVRVAFKQIKRILKIK